jgi:hypothetical protein
MKANLENQIERFDKVLIAPCGIGAFRDPLESGMRSKADAILPETFWVGVRAGTIFRNAFKLICPVQSCFQK